MAVFTEPYGVHRGFVDVRPSSTMTLTRIEEEKEWIQHATPSGSVDRTCLRLSEPVSNASFARDSGQIVLSRHDGDVIMSTARRSSFRRSNSKAEEGWLDVDILI